MSINVPTIVVTRTLINRLRLNEVHMIDLRKAWICSYQGTSVVWTTGRMNEWPRNQSWSRKTAPSNRGTEQAWTWPSGDTLMTMRMLRSSRWKSVWNSHSYVKRKSGWLYMSEIASSFINHQTYTFKTFQGEWQGDITMTRVPTSVKNYSLAIAVYSIYSQIGQAGY